MKLLEVWPAAYLLCFGVLAAVLGSSMERHPSFWGRAALIVSVPATLPLVTGGWGAFFSTFALMIGPPLLYRNPQQRSGGGGDDAGSDPPPAPPEPPTGGIPLPDADQSRARVRDHQQPRRGRRSRRGTREPRRSPVRL